MRDYLLALLADLFDRTDAPPQPGLRRLSTAPGCADSPSGSAVLPCTDVPARAAAPPEPAALSRADAPPQPVVHSLLDLGGSR
jgi:hypothetical protein